MNRSARLKGSVPSAFRFLRCRPELMGAALRSVHEMFASLKRGVNPAHSGTGLMDTDAGTRAGVFFGRLNRRFAGVASRRFSGPSAEFISVNELQTRLSVLRFAPMNNPYRCLRAHGAQGRERVSLTLVLSHFA
jgi:hypothetical protein